MRTEGTASKDPLSVLGISPLASDEEVRAAWLTAAKAYPPDRDPEQFRRIRDAYELLRNAEDRVSFQLFGRPEIHTIEDLARCLEGEPRRPEARLWLDVLRERP